MSDEELIEKTAKALDGNFNPDKHPIMAAMFRDYAATALAVFREHTAPTEPAAPSARVVPNDPITSACVSGYCPSGCSHMMWKCDTCQCEGGWGAPVGRLEDFAREHVCPPDPAPAEPAVTDEMVERAARAWASGSATPNNWENMAPRLQGITKDRMRAALEAALSTGRGE